MKRDDFFKLMRRVRDVAPMNHRVVAALDRPDVQQILQRHREATAQQQAKKKRRTKQ